MSLLPLRAGICWDQEDHSSASRSGRVPAIVIALFVVGLISGITTAGCALSLPWPPPATPSPTVPLPTVEPTPVPTLEPTSVIPPATPTVITLTLWLTSDFLPGHPAPSLKELEPVATAFSSLWPNYRLDWVIKSSAGVGGLVDFILAARDVAPAILPDAVVLDLRALSVLYDAGLLQPAEGLAPADFWNDLFLFARAAAMVDGQWYSIPLAAEIEHLVYDLRIVDASPLTWTDVLSDTHQYAFLAGGENGRVNDSFLIQYLAAGGRLRTEQGLPILDEEPLIRVLTFYSDGVRAGLIPAEVLEMEHSEEVLAHYLAGGFPMCNLRSKTYLINRARMENAAFATIPTWNGSVATIGRTLGLASLTADPPRQTALAKFAEWMTTSEQAARWMRQAGLLSPRVSEINRWGASDSYYAFTRWQLESAFHPPTGPLYDRIYLILQQAVKDVISGALSPSEAARRAVAFVEGAG